MAVIRHRAICLILAIHEKLHACTCIQNTHVGVSIRLYQDKKKHPSNRMDEQFPHCFE